MEVANNSGKGIYFATVIICSYVLISEFILFIVIYFSKPNLFDFEFARSLFDLKDSPIILVMGIFGILTFLISLALLPISKRLVRKQPVSVIQNSIILAVTSVIGSCLCFATSVFGLVSAFVDDNEYFFWWFILGIVGIILHFPRRKYFSNNV